MATHKSYSFDGTRVHFPCEPYEVQKEYMRSVIRCLNQKTNALLESPTGTGKTLALLCSTLAWKQNQNDPKGIIYYSSRTHAQLAQAAKEMKRTAYARIPAVVLGGREQMCLNEQVREQSGNYLINRACRNAVAQNSCQFYSNYESKLEIMDHNNVHDIEDLISFGRSNQCCPYYASRKLAETKASVIFTPYNYILDPSLRKNQMVKLENSIVIFDEAHNIESILEDCVSGELTESALKTIQDCVLKLPKKVSDVENYQKHGLTRTGYEPKNDDDQRNEKSGKKDKEQKVNPILEIIEKLTSERLEEVRVASLNLQQGAVRSFGGYDKECSTEQFYSLLESCGISYGVSDRLIETLDNMSAFLLAAGVQNPTQVANFVTAIEQFSTFVSLAYPDDCLSVIRMKEHKLSFSQYYRAYLERVDDHQQGKGGHIRRQIDLGEPAKDWKFHIWCLSPAIGLKRLTQAATIRSLVITSGTLAPLGPYKDELETTIGVTLESPHVIGRDQLEIILLGKSPENYSLVSDFNESRKAAYHKAIGSTLLRLFQILPCGTVVFFQSYSLMSAVINYWKQTTTWKKMASYKQLFIEPKSKTAFASDIGAYKRAVDQKNSTGAVFFGVCRGKLSEGVNLNDNYCRSVILTGPPFPGITDPKIQMKRKYMDQRSETNIMNMMNGQHWYGLQMKRALNQTIGRVIRSKDDFGLIILCDPRFRRASDSLSNWIRPYYTDKEFTTIEAQRTIVDFFKGHGLAVPEPATLSGGHQIGAFQLSSSNGLSSNGTTSAPTTTTSSSSSNSVVSERDQFRAREAAMVASYTVDRATASRARDRVRQQQESQLASQQQQVNNISASSAFDSLCPPVITISSSSASSSSPSASQPRQSTQEGSQQPPADIWDDDCIYIDGDSLTAPSTTTTTAHAASQDTSKRTTTTTTSASASATTTSTISEIGTVNLTSTTANTDTSAESILSKPKSLNIFARKKPKLSKSQGSQCPNSTASTDQNYSILDQLDDKNRPAPYRCSICLDKAHVPMRSNCLCCRISCRDCWITLLKKKDKCGKCEVSLKMRDFKPLFFNSATRKIDRYTH